MSASTFLKIRFHLLTMPNFSIEPSEIIRLSVVIAQYNVVTIYYLLDLGEGDPISLGTESYVTLRTINPVGVSEIDKVFADYYECMI